MPGGSGASVPGGVKLPYQGDVALPYQVSRRYRYLDPTFPVSQSFSDTICLPQILTILSYLQTCHFRVGNWDPGRHPWSRELADPSFAGHHSDPLIRPGSDPLDPTPGSDLDPPWIRPGSDLDWVCRGGTDISIPLSQFPSHSQTLSVYHRYSQSSHICKHVILGWETGKLGFTLGVENWQIPVFTGHVVFYSGQC